MSDTRTEVEKLQDEFSDFHKDFYGFRPRYATESEWNSAAWLKAEIQAIVDTMKEMEKTFAGREELRANFWVIAAETDPELIKQAKWLEDERKREQEVYEKERDQAFQEMSEQMLSAAVTRYEE